MGIDSVNTSSVANNSEVTNEVIKKLKKAASSQTVAMAPAKKNKPEPILAYTLLTDLGKEKFASSLYKINKDNVVKTLENFEVLSKAANGGKAVQSLPEAIFGEFFVKLKHQKQFVGHIKDSLSKKCQELNIDNTELDKEWTKNFNDKTSGFKPHLGMVDCEKMNFFIKESMSRIKIKERLLKSNAEKFQKSKGDITPNKDYFKIVNSLILENGGGIEDTLGDGKVNHEVKQTNGTCWAVGTINAMTSKPEVKEHLNSFLMKKDGIISVYLPKADKVYSYSEKEVVRNTHLAIGAIGDGDVNAILMATDEYMKEYAKAHPEDKQWSSDVREGNTVATMFDILTGAKSSKWKGSIDDYPPNSLLTEESVMLFSSRSIEARLQNSDDKCALVFSLQPGFAMDKTAEIIKGGKATGEKAKLMYNHVYAGFEVKGDDLYMKDSNYADCLLKVPAYYLLYMDNYAMYKYR